MSFNPDTILKLLLPPKIMTDENNNFSDSTDKLLKENSDTILNHMPSGIYEENLEKIVENIVGILDETDSDTALQIAERFQNTIKARKALIKSIENFDSPEKYEETEVEIKEEAVERSLELVKSLQEELERRDKAYANRIEKAVTSYEQGEYHLPIFLFITVQDAIMQAICEASDNMETDDYWRSYEKEDATTQVYEEIWDLEEEEFEDKLSSYIDHRNYIMHGNPDAVFSEKMADLCLIFLAITLIPLENRIFYEYL